MVTRKRQTDPREAFSKRLNEVLDDHGYPPKGHGRQVQLSKDFDLTQKGVRKWLEGEAIPRREKLEEISDRFQVSIVWLQYGEGVKQYSSPSLNEEVRQEWVAARSTKAKGSNLDKKFIAKLEALPPNLIKVLDQVVDGFLGSGSGRGFLGDGVNLEGAQDKKSPTKIPE